jgi:hypothetical protein
MTVKLIQSDKCVLHIKILQWRQNYQPTYVISCVQTTFSIPVSDGAETTGITSSSVPNHVILWFSSPIHFYRSPMMA